MDDGTWRESADLTNNVLRRFKTLCRRAGIGSFTVHDLRRSCITNWAKGGAPIQDVKTWAGHGDIETTWKYYLSNEASDAEAARTAQARAVGPILEEHLTDPQLTHLAQKRAFPGRQGCQLKKEALDLQGLT